MDHLSQFCQIDSGSLGRPRVDYELEVFSDSNWAGCNVTRKSATLFMVFPCGKLISSACRTQASIGLLLCEAELLAGTAAVGDSIQMSDILRFLVNDEKPENCPRRTLTLHTGSSSAQAAWQCRGSGHLERIDTRMLWLQRMLRKQYIRLQKVPTTYIPSDLNTKKLSRARRDLLSSIVGMTDDRELLMFMPPMPKINGSVMRASITLSRLLGLPVGKSQMIGKQVDLSTDSTTICISTLVVIVVMFMMFWSMVRSNQGDRDRGDEQPGLTECKWWQDFLKNMKVRILKTMDQKNKK